MNSDRKCLQRWPTTSKQKERYDYLFTFLLNKGNKDLRTYFYGSPFSHLGPDRIEGSTGEAKPTLFSLPWTASVAPRPDELKKM